MTKFKLKDRVTDETEHKFAFLGEGTIVAMVTKTACLVLFDKTPHFRYNMGENPTLMFLNDLRHVKGAK